MPDFRDMGNFLPDSLLLSDKTICVKATGPRHYGKDMPDFAIIYGPDGISHCNLRNSISLDGLSPTVDSPHYCGSPFGRTSCVLICSYYGGSSAFFEQFNDRFRPEAGLQEIENPANAL